LERGERDVSCDQLFLGYECWSVALRQGLRFLRADHYIREQRTGANEYNYQPGTPAAAFATRLTPDGPPAKGAAMTGTPTSPHTFREKPGMSAFALEDGTVYHTYSAYARGLDGLWGDQWLFGGNSGRPGQSISESGGVSL
jgi:predicted dithiol-disulfide oxidoreductase (DUF899 family)